MVMGRPNKGVHHVDSCEGSALSKIRTKAVLQTIAGELTVTAAMKKLGIQRPYFAELRLRTLQGAVDALESGRPGRQPKNDDASAQQIAELRAENAALKRENLVLRTRAEIAEILPGRIDDQKGGYAPRRAKSKGRRASTGS